MEVEPDQVRDPETGRTYDRAEMSDRGLASAVKADRETEAILAQLEEV